MQTEISPYDATGYRDEHERLALRRANIMHLVDLKRGGYSPRRTEMRIRLTGRPRSISIYPKVLPGCGRHPAASFHGRALAANEDKIQAVVRG